MQTVARGHGRCRSEQVTQALSRATTVSSAAERGREWWSKLVRPLTLASRCPRLSILSPDGAHQAKRVPGWTDLFDHHLCVCGTLALPTVVRKQCLLTSRATTDGPLMMSCGCHLMLGQTCLQCRKFTHKAVHSRVNGLSWQRVRQLWRCRFVSGPSLFKQPRAAKYAADAPQRAFLHGMVGRNCVDQLMHFQVLWELRWVPPWIFDGAGRMVLLFPLPQRQQQLLQPPPRQQQLQQRPCR